MSEPLFSKQTLPGRDDITRHVYANGVTLLTRPNFSSPAVVVRGYLPVGAVSNPTEKLGLAAFVASCLMTGTSQHDFRSLNDLIESLGASLSFSAGALSTSFAGQCLLEDLPTLLALITEVLSQPTFPERQANRLRAQILTALDIQAQNTADQADETFDKLFYAAHPYALPVSGTPQTIQSVTINDLKEFHANYFSPFGLVISIVGGVKPDDAIHMVGNTLGAWHKAASHHQPELPPFTPPAKSFRGHVALKAKSQTDLIIGALAPATMGEAFNIASLGNNILGVFGMMGRIGESVREKSGLAYYAQSVLGSGLGPVPWQVVAGVNPDNLERAIDLILDELRRFTSEPVSKEELDDSRTQMIGRLPLSFETNSATAQALLSLERYKLDFDYYRDLPDTLAKITPQQILEVARQYWQLDRLVIASSGRAL